MISDIHSHRLSARQTYRNVRSFLAGRAPIDTGEEEGDGGGVIVMMVVVWRLPLLSMQDVTPANRVPPIGYVATSIRTGHSSIKRSWLCVRLGQFFRIGAFQFLYHVESGLEHDLFFYIAELNVASTRAFYRSCKQFIISSAADVNNLLFHLLQMLTIYCSTRCRCSFIV